MRNLTKRQREALTFIQRSVEQNGVSPTFEEIASGLGLAAKSGVHRLVHGLVARGAIEFVATRNRGITLIDDLVTRAQERHLADIAKRTGRTRTELIRQAIDGLIERES